MIQDSEPAACRAFFGETRRTVVRLPSSGFSGSHVLLVEPCPPPEAGSGGRWVLKSFVPGTSTPHAAWVHALMAHLRLRGVGVVPVTRRVLPDLASTPCRPAAPSLVEDAAGLLWEAMEFLPGRAVVSPDAPMRAEAMRSLATIHVAAATLPGDPPRRANSRGIVARVEQAASLRERPWRGRWQGDPGLRAGRRCVGRIAGLFERAIEILSADGTAAIDRIARHAEIEAPCQAVLRDIWRDNVLFDDGRVSGIVDFHAAGIDTVATDLARLVGSWTAEPAGTTLWEECLAAYESIRPLTDEERGLVPFLHHAGVIVAIDNWFRWLVEERRTFPDADAVAERLGRLVAALPGSIAALTGS